MARYTKKELEEVIDRAAEKAAERAAERAVGFYYEKTKHDIDLVLESLDSFKQQFAQMVTRDEFSELAADVRTIRLAVIDTNRELHGFDTPGWFPGKKKR